MESVIAGSRLPLKLLILGHRSFSQISFLLRGSGPTLVDQESLLTARRTQTHSSKIAPTLRTPPLFDGVGAGVDDRRDRELARRLESPGLFTACRSTAQTDTLE